MINPRSIDAQRVISQKNRAGIIQFLRENGETTRFEIASGLSVSHTTVKNYIEKFLDEGVIEEAGTAESIGGRKPVKIRLVPNARYSLGVNIAPGRMDILLLNLMREEIVRKSVTYDQKAGFADVLDDLASEIDHILTAKQIDRTKILGIGMTFPGLVDEINGMVVYSANLGVRDFSLADFAARTGLAVHAENEAQAAAFAERLIGNAKGKNNLVYVSIAEGIGAGIIINGEIYRTGGKNAGEFGHVRISDEPVRCNCGRTGCWERFASADALMDDYIRTSGSPADTLTNLFAAYHRQDTVAVQVLEKYTQHLFKGLDIILLAFSPQEVIIGGDLAEFADDILDLGTQKLGLTQGFHGYENTRISASALKDNAAVLGAALLPMELEGT